MAETPPKNNRHRLDRHDDSWADLDALQSNFQRLEERFEEPLEPIFPLTPPRNREGGQNAWDGMGIIQHKLQPLTLRIYRVGKGWKWLKYSERM